MFEVVGEGNYDGVKNEFYLDKIANADVYQSLTRETAIYPGATMSEFAEEDLLIQVDTLAYLALGLGEAGEVQGKIKKLLRDGALRWAKADENGVVQDVISITPEKRTEILKELGDLQWYVARLSDELFGLLSELMADNVNKLMGRKDRGVLQGSGDNR